MKHLWFLESSCSFIAYVFEVCLNWPQSGKYQILLLFFSSVQIEVFEMLGTFKFIIADFFLSRFAW